MQNLLQMQSIEIFAALKMHQTDLFHHGDAPSCSALYIECRPDWCLSEAKATPGLGWFEPGSLRTRV